MNKYEYKQMKKQQRLEKRKARKQTRDRKKFERLSKTEYKVWHRMLVRVFRLVGPLLALAYAAYKLYDLFWVKVYNEEVLVADSSIKYMFFSAFFAMFIFLWFFPKIFGWVKKIKQANANARNEGQVSYEYSTFLVDLIIVILTAWPLACLYVFNYVATQYGPELHDGFNAIAVAYGFGAVTLLAGSIIQDVVLRRIKKRQKKAEHQSQMIIYDLKEE